MVNGDEGRDQGTMVRARVSFPSSLTLLTIVTGGLALTGAGRLLVWATQVGKQPVAGSVTAAIQAGDQPPRVARGRARPFPRGVPSVDEGKTGAEDPTTGDDQSARNDDEPAQLRLGHLGASELVDLVRTTTDRWLKADVIDQLIARRERAGIPAIAGLLRDPDRDIRRGAADALAELDAEDQVTAVRTALATETDRDVRVVFQEALHELDHASSR